MLFKGNTEGKPLTSILQNIRNEDISQRNGIIKLTVEINRKRLSWFGREQVEWKIIRQYGIF